MPELSRRQFSYQDPLTGWNQALPTDSMKGWRPRPTTPERFDPGPDYKRGQIGVGQRMLNFDAPESPLETSHGGLVAVDEGVDEVWDRSAFRHYGGVHREIFADDPSDEEAARVSRMWESAPVETIGPDVEVRTGQVNDDHHVVYDEADLPMFEVDVDQDHVDRLRQAETFESDAGETVRPWIAEVEGRRYLLEGHHRAVASRTRGTGEFDAHVIRGGNWGQIEEQMYDGPWR